MRRAAGAEVDARNFDKPQPVGNFELTSVNKRGGFRPCREKTADFGIFDCRFVGKQFDAPQVGFVKYAVIVDGHLVFSEMKADIVKAVQTVYDARDDMFAAVALHSLKPRFKVD